MSNTVVATRYRSTLDDFEVDLVRTLELGLLGLDDERRVVMAQRTSYRLTLTGYVPQGRTLRHLQGSFDHHQRDGRTTV